MDVDARANIILTRDGDDYLPEEISDGGFLVTDYTVDQIDDENSTANKLVGNCSIALEDQETGLEFGITADFEIDLDEDDKVENIEFSNLSELEPF
jgi:hypothetical protein